MGIIGLDTSGSGIGIPETMRERALAANALLHSREGAGSDFLGWVHLPSSISDPELAAIGAAAARLRPRSSCASASAVRIWAPGRCWRR